MPTTVVKTIGSAGGRDYSTPQAWEDAAPASLVTADQVWQGQCYNDSEFVSAFGLVLMSGSTSDATRYKELTAASGQSFQDQAGVRSNALGYNNSNGVGFRSTAGYDTPVRINESYGRFGRIQVKNQRSGAYTGAVLSTSGAVGVVIREAIFDCANPGSLGALVLDGCLVVNIVCFVRGSGGNGGTIVRSTLTGCALVRTSDNSATGTGMIAAYTPTIIQSCAIFGFSTATSGGGFTTGSCFNNATDQSSGLPGSGQQYSVTFNATTPFTQAAVSGYDLRAVAATALAANGFLDATNAPNDISGTARANPPTIGAWEIVSAGGSGPVAKALIVKQAQHRASYY